MGPPRVPGVYLDSFEFTGGYPKPPDLAPSIVFTIAVSARAARLTTAGGPRARFTGVQH